MIRIDRDIKRAAAAMLLLCSLAAAPAAAQLRFAFEPASRFGGTAGESVLVMRGEIAHGDRDRLLAFLARNPGAFVEHGDRVAFAIDGGDVLEAIDIGRFLQEALIEVWLPDTGSTRCVSACFLMFAGAAARSAQAETVGIHRPYFSPAAVARAAPANVRNRYNATFRAILAYLDELFVPRSLSERMVDAESNDIYWLSEQDLLRLGRRQAWFADFADASCSEERGECLAALLRRHRETIVNGLANVERSRTAAERIPCAR
jgi:hypothetical protein